MACVDGNVSSLMLTKCLIAAIESLWTRAARVGAVLSRRKVSCRGLGPLDPSEGARANWEDIMISWGMRAC